jgi:hypothetical protein
MLGFPINIPEFNLSWSNEIYTDFVDVQKTVKDQKTIFNIITNPPSSFFRIFIQPSQDLQDETGVFSDGSRQIDTVGTTYTCTFFSGNHYEYNIYIDPNPVDNPNNIWSIVIDRITIPENINIEEAFLIYIYSPDTAGLSPQGCLYIYGI